MHWFYQPYCFQMSFCVYKFLHIQEVLNQPTFVFDILEILLSWGTLALYLFVYFFNYLFCYKNTLIYPLWYQLPRGCFSDSCKLCFLLSNPIIRVALVLCTRWTLLQRKYKLFTCGLLPSSFLIFSQRFDRCFTRLSSV